MEFFINDKLFQTLDSFTIFEIINYLKLQNYPIAVEQNQVFLERANWKKSFIQPFDQIEIVTIVGGG